MVSAVGRGTLSYTQGTGSDQAEGRSDGKASTKISSLHCCLFSVCVTPMAMVER